MQASSSLRVRFLRSALAVTAALTIAAPMPSGAYAAPAAPLEVTVHEGTGMAIALSPDHRQIAFDLQGVLFVMPATGGVAHPITDILYDARQPTWSADAKQIAFQSDRDGHWRVWVIGVDGSNPHPISTGPFSEREPSWSPDGRSLAFVSDRSGKFDVWQMDLTSGALKQRTFGPGGNTRPTWSPDGREIAYVSDRAGAAGVYAVDESNKERLIAPSSVFSFGMTIPLGTPSWRPGGHDVLYTLIPGGESRLMLNDKVITAAEDVHPFRAAWISQDEFLYAADGRIKRRSLKTGQTTEIPFTASLMVQRPLYAKKSHDFDSTTPKPVTGVQRAVLSPDGRQIAFTALGGLWVMPIGGAPRRLTAAGPYAVVDPSWSPDGKSIAYASDRAGSLDIWVHDLSTGAERQVTSAPGAEMRPAFSPDGKSIAYVDAFGAYAEIVHVINADGANDRVLKAAGDSPGYPAWSPDGRSLMVSRLKSYSTAQSYYAGGVNQITIASVFGAGAHDVDLVADHSVGDRSGDGPAWSPDGRQVAYAMDGGLWVQPVTATGDSAGPPRKINDAVVNAVSWSGDSRTLLAQTGSTLRLIDAATGAQSVAPLKLDWTPAKPAGRITIHAGRLADGVHPNVLTDVDIVVEGNRIIAVQPHKPGATSGKVIDATSLTVMPGLMDMHEHLIKEFGSSFGRLLLSWGVTTVRSPGNVPGDILEEREAIDAGQRPGPRLFITGYILDGDRTVWEMGTTVSSAAEADKQVKLEADLGYDMVKTYVHTSEPLRQRMVQDAHRYGLLVSSHEIYPAAAFGSDSVEHLDGNGSSRGYSTKTSELNIAYDDVAAILSASGMTVTPTMSLFTPLKEMLGSDPSTDPRWGLQPSWVRNPDGPAFSLPGGDILQANVRRSILKLHRAGAKIVVGTDSPFSPVGVNTHNELEQEVKAGLTPFEALQTATKIPAELLGVQADLGSVEAGKLADLVFVEGDPLSDIRAARNVKMVMKNGQLFNLEDLVTQRSQQDAAR